MSFCGPSRIRTCKFGFGDRQFTIELIGPWLLEYSKTLPFGSVCLFFSLFMDGVFLTPFAILFQLNFTGHQLLILAGPVVNALAGIAGQFDESIL